jgi:hypothetical protein
MPLQKLSASNGNRDISRNVGQSGSNVVYDAEVAVRSGRQAGTHQGPSQCEPRVVQSELQPLPHWFFLLLDVLTGKHWAVVVEANIP